MPTARISLQAAAERLGVHYQTAYRWVRSGSLQAVKVRGVYQVEESDLEAFDQERHRPEPPPTERTVRDWGRFVDQLHDALVAGEEGSARDIVDGLVSGGVRIVDCCDRMIAPAMQRVGTRWMLGELSVAEERRASFICERLLGRINPSPPGRPRGTAVVVTPSADEHQLPGQMATAVLREDHWRVHHFGTGVPDADLAGMVRRLAPDLVVVSSVWPPARDVAAALGDALRSLGPRVLVGEAGATLGDLVELARGGGRSGR
ncbi:MAG TPA: B12-binding domain-containing protein [Acidimicrobiales bacterium]|nr:B12-binding domain-containing protein [Acidimicrobiales bacterium]